MADKDKRSPKAPPPPPTPKPVKPKLNSLDIQTDILVNWQNNQEAQYGFNASSPGFQGKLTEMREIVKTLIAKANIDRNIILDLDEAAAFNKMPEAQAYGLKITDPKLLPPKSSDPAKQK